MSVHASQATSGRQSTAIAGEHWPIAFWKMSAAGNDFVIIDHRRPLITSEQMAEFARLVCRRKFGVGADGLFFIENSDQADFKWRFFNADGSEAEMCGNGARCVARFAYMHGIAAARMRFSTLAGIIEASVEDSQVTIQLTPPSGLVLDQRVQVGSREYTVHCINTGVPHAVVFVDDLAHTDVRGLGFTLRHHADFGPSGTNVTFAALTDAGVRIRTYERGVEDETLACGTGAVASALIAALLGRAEAPVTVTTSGGVQLCVLFTPQGDNHFTGVQLKGPAHLVYSGELTPEALAA